MQPNPTPIPRLPRLFATGAARRVFVACLCLLLGIAGPLSAQQVIVPPPPRIAGSAWVLMEAHTGKVLTEANADQQLPPASLTKIMTAYAVAKEIEKGSLSLDDKVPVSVKAWQTGGSRMFIREGTEVPLRDLMRGIVIQSGNDASVAVAEYVSGSEDAFADLMNIHADALGMTNTQFRNATGLPDDEHHTSAADLARLSRALITELPEHYRVYSEKEFTYNGIRQENRNKLLQRDRTVDGIKTGHTDAAGFCLVASAVRNDMRLISVVMGADSPAARERETQKLLSYGFRYFETRPIYDAGDAVTSARIWGGAADSVVLTVAEPIVETIPRGSYETLDAEMEIDSVIAAPVAAGQRLGSLRVSLGGEVVVERPLVAAQAVEPGGFFKRMWHWLQLLFMSWFG